MSAIRLLLPKSRLLRWYERLIELLIIDRHSVGVELCAASETPGAALQLVEQLETLLYNRAGAGSLGPATPGEWSSRPIDAADIVVDLTGASRPREGAIAPLYDGAFGDLARDAAILEGRAPEVVLAVSEPGGLAIFAQGRPAVERPQVLASGRSAVADCLTTLIRTVARDPVSRAAPGTIRPTAGAGRPLSFLTHGVASAARRRLTRLVSLEGHWRIGWRSLNGAPSAIDALAWPKGDPWRWLSDDRRRFFADPFLFREEGTTYVFCEEFPYATGKGVISVFTLDEVGRPSAPRVVLERPCHLSYPHIFRHDGRIWMMPETSANRTLELYVADAFPDRWTLHSVLLSDLSVSDATAFEHGGRWWLTAATNEPGASTWDSLSLFSAASPIAGWTRCGDLPVLVDASAARPAGQVVRRDGVLWRPAQDCTRGYGSGLALCRIDEIGEGVLRQSVVRRLAPPDGALRQGVHTLNSDGGFEIIDAVGAVSRAPWLEGEAA